jgi:hypothetical protein
MRVSGDRGLTIIASALAIVCGAIGLIYLVIGGFDYPALATTSWFVTLAIVMALLLVLACLWNGWSVLSRATGWSPDAPIAEPAWLGASMGLALAASLGVVAARIPANGVGQTLACLQGHRCYVQYGSSRTELGLAAAMFFLDAVLFGTLGVWALRRSNAGSDISR